LNVRALEGVLVGFTTSTKAMANIGGAW